MDKSDIRFTYAHGSRKETIKYLMASGYSRKEAYDIIDARIMALRNSMKEINHDNT